MRVVRGMGQGFSDPHAVFCEVRLVGAWIKRQQVMKQAWRIRSEKLTEYQCRGYARFLETKSVKWNGESNVKHMWEQVK